MRKFVLVLIVLTSLAGCSSTKNPVTDQANNSVIGTTWLVTQSRGSSMVFDFMEDGTLDYISGEKSYSNGTWTQSGDSIYIEMNNRFAERAGLISGEAMEGKAWNKKGKKWTWSAARQ